MPADSSQSTRDVFLSRGQSSSSAAAIAGPDSGEASRTTSRARSSGLGATSSANVSPHGAIDGAAALPDPDPPLTGQPSAPYRFSENSFFTSSFGTDWDPSYGSFLDLVHLYEPQGELANEHKDLIHREGNASLTWDRQAFSPAVNVSAVPRTEPPAPPTATHSSPPAPTPRVAAKHEAGPERIPATQTSAGHTCSTSAGAATVSRMSNSRPTSVDESRSGNVAEAAQTGAGAQVQADRTPSTAGGWERSSAVMASGDAQEQPGSLPASAGPSKKANTCILPPEKVFPIQIGSELFRLSGASIASDAPSYFSQFFEEQLRQTENGSGIRTLYIDRDPVIFQDISRHLQGYHVKPRDGAHFVRLFADAQFYSLPRLISQLFESEIFIQIGDRHFQVPRDIFSGPGDSPNFFSLGFAVFFASPSEVFPGLDRKGLLRPPSIVPPSVPNRSGEVFAELLHLLRGYPLHIRNEEHRAELLRDCRYFHLRGLEQKLIPHHISYNPERQRSEIVIRLEDIRQSGVQFVSDSPPSDGSPAGGWVYYARPFVDETSYELVVEIGGESTVLDLDAMRADFHGLAKARVASLFQVVANKMNLPTNAPLGLMMMMKKKGGAGAQSASPGNTPLSEDRVKIRIDRDADVTVDGEPFVARFPGLGTGSPLATASVSLQREPGSNPGLQNSPPSLSSKQQVQPQQPGHSQYQTPRTLLRTGQPPAKRKRQDSPEDLGGWIVRKGQWRLRVQPTPTDVTGAGLELVLVAVKLDVYTCQRARNMQRSFLS
ncbi:hypothetical protein VTN02DRAFT_714 [Thermoascus thermophilus]